MDPKIEVYFIIAGEIPPDEITNSVGISPSRIRNKGDSNQGTLLVWKRNAWILDADVSSSSIDLADHITPLLDILVPKAGEIIELCNKHDLYSEISCAIYIVDVTPAIVLSLGIIEAIAKLRTTIDIDLILTA